MRFTLATGHCLIEPDQTSFNKTSTDVLPQCVAMHDDLTVDAATISSANRHGVQGAIQLN
jgi:hypothetical protein